MDLTDCDAPLPRNYADGIRDGDLATKDNPVFPCFRFLAEFTQLSILLGRARECVRVASADRLAHDPSDRFAGSLSGLQTADDLSLLLLQMNIDTWTTNLPLTWQYSVNLVLDQAPQLMNLFIVALEVSMLACPITSTFADHTVHLSTLFSVAHFPYPTSINIPTVKRAVADSMPTGGTGSALAHDRWGPLLSGHLVEHRLSRLLVAAQTAPLHSFGRVDELTQQSAA